MASRQLPPMHTQSHPPSHHGSSRSTTTSSTPTLTQPPTGHTNHRTTAKPLNFQQAMSDFRGMFPEIDRDVIETVLRANNGVVQTTIDQLLELQECTIVEQAATSGPVLPSYESSIGEGEEPPPAYNDIWENVGAPMPDPLFPNPKNATSSAVDKIKTFPRNSLWNAPLIGKLPTDFLRLDEKAMVYPAANSHLNSSRNHGNTAPGGDKDFMTEDDIERFMEDEKLALFLQNEEFLRELRRNREFVSSLEADHQEAMMAEGSPVPPAPTSVGSGGARPRTTPTQEDAQFRQKLKHMGKSTRKKFGKMAKKFSRTKSTGKPPMTMAPSESMFNLLGDDDNEEDNRNNENLYQIDEEDKIENNIDGVSEMNNRLESYTATRPRPRPSVRAGRQLPQPPSAQTSNPVRKKANDEPIVFYGEDNEFDYKHE